MSKTPSGKIFATKDKSKAKQKVTDGFQNFVAKIGVGPQGQQNNLLSTGEYYFNLVTRNRIQLEAAYRGSWIVGRVIDSYANDMTRAGIDINTNEGAEDLQEFEVQMSRLQIWRSIANVIRWARLYGGAIGVIQLQGQKLDTPLNPDAVKEGQFQGIVVYDRWQIIPVLTEIIDSGPEMGLPKYYDIVLGSNLNDPGQEPGGTHTKNPTGQVRVHHSRCIRMEGIHLPFYQAITEMMWGESVLERMWDRLIAFDTATMSCASLVNRAQLRTVGIDGLREILAAGGEAQEALVAQFHYMAEIQQNEGITLIDKNDTFASTAYTFSGLSDTMVQFGQQVSGSSEIPLVVLFGQSPAGMNATGESDLRLYYDGVNSKQEAELRPSIETLIKVMWRSVTGNPIPQDLSFTFTPLWQMSALDKATIAKSNTETIIEASQEGAIDTATMMKELKQASGTNGLFTHITDEQIEEAESEPPPAPPGEEKLDSETTSPDGQDDPHVTGSATGELTAGPTKPKGTPKANDTKWVTRDQRTIQKWLSKDEDSNAAKKAEIAKLREQADREDDKNNHHKAEALREKARKLERELR